MSFNRIFGALDCRLLLGVTLLWAGCARHGAAQSLIDCVADTPATCDFSQVPGDHPLQVRSGAMLAALTETYGKFVMLGDAQQFTVALYQLAAKPTGVPITAPPACTSDAMKNPSGCTVANKGGATLYLIIQFVPSDSAQKNASLYLVKDGALTSLVSLTGVGYAAKGIVGVDCVHADAYAYSDCDQRAGLGFIVIGGLEESYLSSQENQTNGFVRAFAKVNVPLKGTSNYYTWAVVRDLGAPQANSNGNIVTAFSDPEGTITTSTLATVGYSLDFLAGGALEWNVGHTNGQYSWGPILGLGATTPLSSTSATSGYMVPAFGTQACAQLQQLFTTKGSGTFQYPHYSPGLTAATGTETGSLAGACLINAAPSPAVSVTTLAFAGINRSNFLEKWEFGVRTIYRSYSAAGQSSCDVGSPCQRGVADFSIGQDAAVTQGELRHFVFKADVVQPFPYSSGYLYLYGTAALRFRRNINQSPLILQSASASDLSAAPSAATFVEPLLQPDKDFYRIGVGLSIDKIFTKLKQPSSN